MRVDKLTLERYRNLKAVSIEPADGVNILYGDNAQGKTNAIEAIWLFTGGKSFRGSKDSELVAMGEESARLEMAFFAEDRDQTAVLDIKGRRQATINGVPQRSAGALAGRFLAVVFSPAHLSLTEDGPDFRRKFIDAAYCQLRPAYMGIMADYQKTLAQRNALLKDGRFADEALLDIFDERLAIAGVKVMAARTAYVKKLAPVAAEKHAGLSAGKETLTLRYEPTADGSSPQALLDSIRAARSADMAAGFTTVGPHRDELAVEIDGNAVRRYGSQGQKRSAVLSMKLAEAALIEDVMGEKPVILLDDVMSELDATRQDFLLHHMAGEQVFITCCDPEAVSRFGNKHFHVENGCITPV